MAISARSQARQKWQYRNGHSDIFQQFFPSEMVAFPGEEDRGTFTEAESALRVSTQTYTHAYRVIFNRCDRWKTREKGCCVDRNGKSVGIAELSVTGGWRVSASIQLGVDATRDLERLAKDVHVTSRPDFVHDEKGKCAFPQKAVSAPD